MKAEGLLMALSSEETRTLYAKGIISPEAHSYRLGMKIFNLEIKGFLAIKVIPTSNRKRGGKTLAACRVYLQMGLFNLLGKGRVGIVDPEEPSQSCVFEDCVVSSPFHSRYKMLSYCRAREALVETCCVKIH